MKLYAGLLMILASMSLHGLTSTSKTTAGAVNTKASTTTTVTQSQSYSASTVYPSEVYCPKGFTCAFQAPTFIISAP